jgi:hypothetical protein
MESDLHVALSREDSMKNPRAVSAMATFPLSFLSAFQLNAAAMERDVDRGKVGGESQKRHFGWEKGKHEGWEGKGKHKGVVRHRTAITAPTPK